MNKFIRELEPENVYIRDKWQFELKSEFFASHDKKSNFYIQEFYFFIPNSLSINNVSYLKDDFYNDQSNFVRYKTPVLTFDEINDLSNPESSLFQINKLLLQNLENEKSIEDELKLLGNIVRSLIRKKVLNFTKKLTKEKIDTYEIELFREDILTFFEEFNCIIENINNTKKHSEHLIKHFHYVHEFMRNSVYYYFTNMLNLLRQKKNVPNNEEIDKKICEIIADQIPYVHSFSSNSDEKKKNSKTQEFILYRIGLLNKFVIDALLLKIGRTSPDVALNNFIGSIAAGIAMAFYVILLFAWQGTTFIINTEAFIIASIILYILKDRVKETLRLISFKWAFKWFPDFTTKIKSHKGDTIGVLKESVSFLKPNKIPQDIVYARNRKYHDILSDFTRPETTLYYKKKLSLKYNSKKFVKRKDLNIIFRFNIHKFLLKADDPYQMYYHFDTNTNEIKKISLPKVYHLNLIQKNTFINEQGREVYQYNKFRLVVDKNGIKRIENIW